MADRNIDEVGMRLYHQTVDGMRLYFPPSAEKVITVAPARINPYAVETTQRFPLGTRLIDGDREFRYAKAGNTIPVANLVQGTVPLAGHIDEVVNEPAADATTIAFTPNTVTTDDITANQFRDGYIHINDDTGEGYMYRIKSHPAILGGASGTITLYDPIVVALGANATATIHYNRYKKFLIHASPPTALLAGVTCCPVVLNDFCWLGVAGPFPVLTQGTLVIADFCVPSATVDGAVMPSAAVETDGPPVGMVMAVNADTEYSAIWLNIP